MSPIHDPGAPQGADDPSLPLLAPGGLLSGRYLIERYVAEGGMGRIYKALDQSSSQPVAVKLLHDEQASLEERLRFHQEARALIAVQHPNVARVFSVDESRAGPCLVMEWLDGEPLSKLIEEGQVPIRQAVRVALDVARALDCAHARGILHRDIKPSNVMVLPPGAEGEREAKLLDFGVAHLQDAVIDDSNRMLGTVLYMAPEQLRAIPGRVDARSDLYSLGVLMFELLTGQLPMARQSLFALVVSHRTRRPPPAHTVAPHVHPQLSRIVGRLLALDPGDRYQSARSLSADLERWLAEPDEPFELDQNKAAEALADEAPLVGRDAVAAELGRSWTRTCQGSGTGVLIWGAEGVGKTRLVREVLSEGALKQRLGHFLSAAQYPASCASPYQTLNALLDAYLLRMGAAQEGAAREAIKRRLVEEVGPLAPLVATSLTSAQALLASAVSPSGVEALNRGSERERQVDVVARAMLALPERSSPVVYAFDDLQWANPVTLAVVERMLQLASHGTWPVMVVAVWSGDQPPRSLYDSALTRLSLAPLAEADASALIAGMLQTERPPERLVRSVWEQARGVPFLIEELLRMAVLDGELRYEPEAGWTFAPSSNRADTRTSSADAARRVRRLGVLESEVRELLTVAAVLEHPMMLEELVETHAAAGRPPLETSRLLDILRVAVDEERLLARTGERYTWRHRHIQQATLAQLSEDEHISLHRAALVTLSGRSGVEAGRMAWHAWQSGDAASILAWVPAAAFEAARTYANEDAERWFELLLQTAPAHPEASAWRDALIDALYLMGRYDKAVEHLNIALAQAGEALDARRLGLMRKRADACFGRGDLQQATVELEAILATLGRMPGPPPQGPPPPGTPPPGLVPAGPDDALPALDEVTRVELSTCERLQLVYAFTAPIKLVPVTLQMAARAGQHKSNRWRGQAAMVMGFGLCRRGELVPSGIYFNHARACFEATGTPLDLAWCDYLSTRLLIARGELAEAYERVARAATTFRRHGEQWNRLTCATTGAVIAWLRGDLEAIYKMVANAREVMEHTRSHQHRLWVRRWELSLAFLAGQLDGTALDELRELTARMLEVRDLLAAIMTMERCAEIALEKREFREAYEQAERAIGLMEQHQQFEPWLYHLYLYRLEARLGQPGADDAEATQRDLAHLERSAQSFPLLRPTLADARASLALHAGDAQQALALLAEARAAYEGVGHARRAWEMARRRVELLERQGAPTWQDEAHELADACVQAGWPHAAQGLKQRLPQRSERPAPPSVATPPASSAARSRSNAPAARSASAGVDDTSLETVASARPLSNAAPAAPPARLDIDDTEVSQGPRALQHLVQQAVRVAQAERGVLYRIDGDPAAPPQPVAWCGLLDHELHSPAMATGRSVVAAAARTGAPRLTTNFEHAGLDDTLSSVAHDTLRSLLVLPLTGDHDATEEVDALVLYLDRPLSGLPFDVETLDSVQLVVPRTVG